MGGDGADGTAEEMMTIVEFVGFEGMDRGVALTSLLDSSFGVGLPVFKVASVTPDGNEELSCDDEMFQNNKKHRIIAVRRYVSIFILRNEKFRCKYVHMITSTY